MTLIYHVHFVFVVTNQSSLFQPKFCLYDFEEEQSCEVGLTSWILLPEGATVQGCVKNETLVPVKWPNSEVTLFLNPKKTLKTGVEWAEHPAKIVTTGTGKLHTY